MGERVGLLMEPWGFVRALGPLYGPLPTCTWPYRGCGGVHVRIDPKSNARTYRCACGNTWKPEEDR